MVVNLTIGIVSKVQVMHIWHWEVFWENEFRLCRIKIKVILILQCFV